MNDASRPRLGAALRSVRRQRGWTLAELSRRTGFSISTLSKVENNQLSLSYDKLIRLSTGLDADVSELFVPQTGSGQVTQTARRSINRRGDGELVPTNNYDYWYLSTDVTRKKLIPILIDLHARTPEEFGELVRHPGEEFVYVLEGEIELLTDPYAPQVLRAGDSAYLDSTMGHGFLARGKGPWRMLAICSAAEKDLRTATGGGMDDRLFAARRAARRPAEPFGEQRKPKRKASRRRIG